MKHCPYCGFANYDQATECRKCQAAFAQFATSGPASKSRLVGPEKARNIRGKALSFVVLGLLIHVYWGGYGPWPVVDYPILAGLRAWLEPLFLYGGLVGYVAGWVLNWI